MRPLNQDLRQRIIEARLRGHGTGEVCKFFGVSRRSVERFWKQHTQTGQTRPKQVGGYRRSRLADHDQTVRGWIAAQPDVSLVQLQKRCQDKLQVTIGITALWHRLQRLGLSFKKTTRAAEQDRPDAKQARTRWREQQPRWDSRRLVFIDETGLNTKMARWYGRSPKGQRCLSAVPHGHWQTSTLIAALRHEQMTAPFLVDGPMDAEVFLVYLEQVLGPCLQPGDTLILDDLATHKVPGVVQFLSAKGVELRYLPPYSPDLNPIEMAFAKLKAHLRQVAARTLAQLQFAGADALNTFSAAHCNTFFRHALYAPI